PPPPPPPPITITSYDKLHNATAIHHNLAVQHDVRKNLYSTYLQPVPVTPSDIPTTLQLPEPA
ncbi:hypothetical protein, partial [Escherichia coli]|uniref:hypothetical protein n=1 Tax=Escherichia coli TaxID=562 RepID=UPI001BAEBCA9